MFISKAALDSAQDPQPQQCSTPARTIAGLYDTLYSNRGVGYADADIH